MPVLMPVKILLNIDIPLQLRDDLVVIPDMVTDDDMFFFIFVFINAFRLINSVIFIKVSEVLK